MDDLPPRPQATVNRHSFCRTHEDLENGNTCMSQVLRLKLSLISSTMSCTPSVRNVPWWAALRIFFQIPIIRDRDASQQRASVSDFTQFITLRRTHISPMLPFTLHSLHSLCSIASLRCSLHYHLTFRTSDVSLVGIWSGSCSKGPPFILLIAAQPSRLLTKTEGLLSSNTSSCNLTCVSHPSFHIIF